MASVSRVGLKGGATSEILISQPWLLRTQASERYRYNLRMDHHTLAAVSIVGTSLDVLGTLYLAYDLLGGQHGPLRLLTRAVTYSVVFGIGYGICFGCLLWSSRRYYDRDYHCARTQPYCPRPRSLFVALGIAVRGHSGTWFWSRALPKSGPQVRNRLCRPYYPRPNSCLFSRHASHRRLRSISPGTTYPSPVLGNDRAHRRVHCHCADLQHVRPSRGPRLVICHSGRLRNWHSHRSRNRGHSSHRILRRQPSRASVRCLRDRTHPLRLCFAIRSVLAGAI